MSKQNQYKYHVNGKEVSMEEFNSCNTGYILYVDDFEAFKIPVSHSFSAEKMKVQAPFFLDEVLDQEYEVKAKKIIEEWNKPYETNEKEIANGWKGDDAKESVGKKESQTVKKAPIFTFCKQMKNAIEQLAFRTEYGHNKYIEFDTDYNNFARVENGDEEYGNAMFRHSLGIGEDTELEHYVASAWDSIARLEIYLRKNLHNSK